MDIDQFLELIRVASRKKTKFHEYDNFEDLSPQMLADSMRLAEDGKLTISRIQAQFNYGYTKAMRVIEQLKEIGIENYPQEKK
ncbi:MAG: hypothetical protein LBM12_00650 [Candidatus Nomurabacteria bacterium]|jgi:DNA segregation ATPase FtsK/SpoIIIE-like protein|nr:hypothetical protein [Candidatus Nomurabacteria bacterium]